MTRSAAARGPQLSGSYSCTGPSQRSAGSRELDGLAAAAMKRGACEQEHGALACPRQKLAHRVSCRERLSGRCPQLHNGPPGHQPTLTHEESTVASGTLQIDCQMGERRGRWHVATKGRAWRGRDARREGASAHPKGPSPKNRVIATATARASRPISLSASIARVAVRDCCACTEAHTLTRLTMPTYSPS